MKEPKWICVKDWARNRKGDIVENYEFKRFPMEIRQSCFKEYKSEPRTAPRPPRNIVGGSPEV